MLPPPLPLLLPAIPCVQVHLWSLLRAPLQLLERALQGGHTHGGGQVSGPLGAGGWAGGWMRGQGGGGSGSWNAGRRVGARGRGGQWAGRQAGRANMCGVCVWLEGAPINRAGQPGNRAGQPGDQPANGHPASQPVHASVCLHSVPRMPQLRTALADAHPAPCSAALAPFILIPAPPGPTLPASGCGTSPAALLGSLSSRPGRGGGGRMTAW